MLYTMVCRYHQLGSHALIVDLPKIVDNGLALMGLPHWWTRTSRS